MPQFRTRAYLLALCLSGSSEVVLGGGEKCYADVGSIFLVAPGTAPSQRFTSAIELLLLEIAPEIIQQISYEVSGGKIKTAELCWDADEGIRCLMMALYHDAAQGSRGGALLGESMAVALASAILKTHSEHDRPAGVFKGGLPQYKLRNALKYIDENLGGNISLVDMAETVQMSACHFARSFKETMGVSPHQYLLKRRVEHAVNALKQDDCDLSSLAADLGFSSQGHFTTVFRKAVGTTPGSYRTQSLTRKRPPASVRAVSRPATSTSLQLALCDRNPSSSGAKLPQVI